MMMMIDNLSNAFSNTPGSFASKQHKCFPQMNSFTMSISIVPLQGDYSGVLSTAKQESF